MLRRVLGLIGLLAAASLAVAGPQGQARKTQKVRAGIVILESAKVSGSQGMSVGPFALYNLDKATSVKPVGWNIYNPHAPGAVTGDIQNRYIALNTPTKPDIGSPVTKNTQEYWNVYLANSTDQSLADYDLLLLNPYAYASLTAAEREKLTRFVDQGGVLWIDTGGLAASSSGINEVNNFPLAFVNRVGSGAQFADRLHPLLSTPNKLTSSDLNLLHPNSMVIGQINPGSDEGAARTDSYLPLFAQFSRFRPITFLGTQPSISLGQIGDGYIVVTPQGPSIALNHVLDPVNRGSLLSNNDYVALQANLPADGVAAAKLAVNIVSLATDYRQDAGGSRKSSSGSIDLTAPLLTRFSNVNTGAPTGATIYKGLAVSVANGRLMVYDAVPNRDLDGDGDPDDGIWLSGNSAPSDGLRDSSKGLTYDLIWQSGQIGSGAVSSPVCVELPDQAGTDHSDMVLVVDSAGRLHGFDLMKHQNGHLLGGTYAETYSVAPPSTVGTVHYEGQPIAPTVHDGLAFVAASSAASTSSTNPMGMIWLVDISQGVVLPGSSGIGESWRIGGPEGTSGLQSPTGSPTVGYIPVQDNSGALDRVVYLPGISTSNKQPGISSLWLGVRGETPDYSIDVDGSSIQLNINTRAARAGGPNIYFPQSNSSEALKRLGVKVSLSDINGNPLSASALNSVFSSVPAAGDAPGKIRLVLADPTVTDRTTFDAKYRDLRVDYSIDWSATAASSPQPALRGSVVFPSPSLATNPPPRQILGNVAMSPRGTIYAVVGNPVGYSGANDSLKASTYYALREDLGRGSFRMVSKFDLYNDHNILLNQTATQSYAATFQDTDDLTTVPAAKPFLNAPMHHFAFVGGPSVRNGVVYVVANAFKSPVGLPFSVPVSILMAFKAEPETPELRVGNLGDNVTLVQPDFTRSSSLTTPETSSSISTGTFTYDKNQGVIRLDSLCAEQNGAIQNSISLSQPIIIRVPGSPDQLREPEASGDRWTPLLWYSVFNGGTMKSGPLVTGGTAFVSGSSALPSILLSGVPKAQGVVWAMDTDFGVNNSYVKANASRPWLNQVYQLDSAQSGNSTFANPAFRMPQLQGITDFDTYKIRLNQSVLVGSDSVQGLAGGEGSLLAWTNKGLFGLSKADFLVCDEGRVLRVDSSGNALEEINSFINAGSSASGFAGTVKTFSRPTKAYAVGESDLLVVDSGANRVVRADKTGTEIRALEKYIPDYNHLPAGYVASQPRTFNSPSDVLTYENFVYHNAGDPELLTGQKPIEYWIHYLVADTGNHRLVEMVDRYEVDSATFRIVGPVMATVPMPDADPVNGQIPTTSLPQLGVLYWQSPANVSGKDFNYSSISREFVKDHYVYVAGIANAQPARSDAGLDSGTSGTSVRESAVGNGGFVVFDPTTPGGTRVYNRFMLDDLSGTRFWNTKTGQYDFGTFASSKNGGYHYFSGVTSVTSSLRSAGSGSVLAVMVSDANGVYEFTVDPSTAISDDQSVLGKPIWMINSLAYTSIRTDFSNSPSGSNPRGFRPTYAKRLDSGEVLIVNGYTGTKLSGDPFKGEVVMLDGLADDPTHVPGRYAVGINNLGFTPMSLRFALPPVSLVRGLVAPVFADRR